MGKGQAFCGEGSPGNGTPYCTQPGQRELAEGRERHLLLEIKRLMESTSKAKERQQERRENVENAAMEKAARAHVEQGAESRKHSRQEEIRKMTASFCSVEGNSEKQPCLIVQLSDRNLSSEERQLIEEKIKGDKSMGGSARNDKEDMLAMFCGDDESKIAEAWSICNR